MAFGPCPPDTGEPDEVEFPGRGQRRHGRLLSVLGVALIALAGGAGIAYAAQHSASRPAADASSTQSGTPSASKSPAPSRRGQFPKGFGQGGFGFGSFAFAGLGGAIHGQVTVPKSGGGYQTLDLQRGTVTAVSSSSITVKSADGFTASYAVSSSTEVNAQAAGISTVKVGQTVILTATASNGTATADSIIDFSGIKSSRGWFGFGLHGSRSSRGQD